MGRRKIAKLVPGKPRPNADGDRSTVWECFDRIDNDKVKCSGCSKEYMYSGSTSSLKYHIDRCTSTQSLLQMVPERPMKQLSFVDSVREKAPLGNQSSLETKLVEALVMAGLSFRQMDHRYMKRLFRELNPRFKIPSRRRIRKLLDSTYTDAVAKVCPDHVIPVLTTTVSEFESNQIESGISNIPSVALTTDSATTISGSSLQAVTAHFLTAEWKPVSLCVALFDMEGNDRINSSLGRNLKPSCRISHIRVSEIGAWGRFREVEAERQDRSHHVGWSVQYSEGPERLRR